MSARRTAHWTGACCLLAGLAVVAAHPAGATTARSPLLTAGTATCTGTEGSPGVLADTYPSGVVVKGYCQVDGGAAVVDGNLIVAAGATLDASFAKNDVAGTGTSSLTVTGNLKVGNGATLFMGCEPGYLACTDDPGGTLSGSDHIGGSLSAGKALAVVVHASSVTGNVSDAGGGGGVTCAIPTGGLFGTINSPVYSDYEDDTIGGNFHVTGLQTCWIGILRNTVTGNFVDSGNTFSDQDANETLQNTVLRNITCAGNSPAVHFGDSGGSQNVVTGKAYGECAFSLPSGTPVSKKA